MPSDFLWIPVGIKLIFIGSGVIGLDPLDCFESVSSQDVISVIVLLDNSDLDNFDLDKLDKE